ncbi:MAG: electron transport complex subunit RsxB [Gammaproteobacteria bacterium]|nr:electron transport complex subunit RsxB [Gammaproteobacteria bacterium]
MSIAVLTIAIIALVAGVALSFASRRLPSDSGNLVEQVNDLLPQTQCAQCGYPGCRPYATAIVDGSATINLCPPGGADTVQHLADLLGRDVIPVVEPAAPSVAVIDESLCIGCVHCRNACPVDAIVGAQHFMHTIIESECTGCELCVAPCPVDCISMRPLGPVNACQLVATGSHFAQYKER